MPTTHIYTNRKDKKVKKNNEKKQQIYQNSFCEVLFVEVNFEFFNLLSVGWG